MNLQVAWAPPVVRTPRLVIRPFTVDDLEPVHAFARAYPASVYGSWLGGSAPSDVARYLADTIARYGRPPRCDVGVAVDGRLVGSVAFRQVWVDPPALDVGWVIHPDYAGRGLVREALAALITTLFERFPDMSRVESRVRASDTNGVRMLEGFGFVREGVLRQGAGNQGDAAIFGVLRSEWTPGGDA